MFNTNNSIIKKRGFLYYKMYILFIYREQLRLQGLYEINIFDTKLCKNHVPK